MPYQDDLRRYFGEIARYAEPALTAGSAAIAEPVSGLAGLGALLRGRGVDGAVESINAAQQAMTYQPRTMEGQQGLQGLQAFLQPVGEVIQDASQNLGDKAYSATGSPALAAAAYSAPTAFLEGLGLKGLNIARKPVSGADLYSARMGTGAVGDIDSLIEKARADYEQKVKPLREMYRNADAATRDELMPKIKALKAELTALEQQKALSEIRSKQQGDSAPAQTKPAKFGKYRGKAYHATSADFDEFDFKKSRDNSIWFTTNKGDFDNPQSSASAAAGKGRLIEVDLDLDKLAGWPEINKYTTDELISMGYDGALLDGNIQIFNSGRVKLPSVSNKDDGITVFRGVGEGSDDSIIKWVSPDESIAKGYAKARGGNVESATVKINNPAKMGAASRRDKPASLISSIIRDASSNKGYDVDAAKRARKEFIDYFGNEPLDITDLWSTEEAKGVTSKMLKSLGYDAISVTEQGVDTYGLIK